jgi:hypothetical protein
VKSCRKGLLAQVEKVRPNKQLIRKKQIRHMPIWQPLGNVFVVAQVGLGVLGRLAAERLRTACGQGVEACWQPTAGGDLDIGGGSFWTKTLVQKEPPPMVECLCLSWVA